VTLDPLRWALQKLRWETRVDPTELAELEEAHQPQRDAAVRVLRHGRTVYGAYDADGHLHLRRRARQIRRSFGVGFAWRAMPRSDRGRYIVRRRSWYEWWWW
jgi:hypothetical protein